MDDKALKEAIDQIRTSKKRNFTQSVDIIYSLKDIDFKNPEHQKEFFVNLPHGRGKKVKVCALVGPELADQAKKVCDFVILQSQFDEYGKDTRKAKKLAREYDFFIGQTNLMAKIATSFGRVLGPRGKMPNPKAGCIVPSNANLKQIHERLQKTIRLSTKKRNVMHAIIGKEDMSDQALMENIKATDNIVLHQLPQGQNNIKSVHIKYSMGQPVKI